MTAILAIWQRELLAYRSIFSSGITATAFLIVFGWTFVMMLNRCEGSVIQVQSIWGLAAAPWLPVFASILAMRLFAEERATHMIDHLLSAPIRERDMVIGKFLALMTVLMTLLALSLIIPLGILPVLSPAVQRGLRLIAFIPTSTILILQCAVYSAVGLFVSALFRSPAVAAIVALIISGGIPTALYLGIIHGSPEMRASNIWIPLLTHVYDFSTGFISLSAILLYTILTILFLFLCSKTLFFLRLK